MESTQLKAQELLSLLDGLQIPFAAHRHPPVFTVAEARALRGEISGAHTKNLFLKDRRDRLYLVTALEDSAIDLKTLHRHIGASGRVSFASAQTLDRVLGVVPGAVSPLALVNDADHLCEVVIDRNILSYDLVNFHPLDNSMTVTMSPAGLQAFLTKTGHPPILVDLDAGAGSGEGSASVG